jgi:type IV pilus assembly protein PilE
VTDRKQRGVTLVELMIVVAIIGILASVAMPSYNRYVVRAARIQAQTELLGLAALQEKIFLNSNSYAFGSAGVTTAYNGTTTGGLGRTSGQTNDGRYAISMVSLASAVNCTDVGATPTVSGAQQFVLLAVPVAGKSQEGDGNLCVSESGRRLWGTASW